MYTPVYICRARERETKRERERERERETEREREIRIHMHPKRSNCYVHPTYISIHVYIRTHIPMYEKVYIHTCVHIPE